MRKYRYLLFDADETLFDFPQSERLAASKVLKDYNLPCGEETVSLYSRINNSLWQRFNLGEIPREQIRRERFSRLLEALGRDPALGPELDRSYAAALGGFGVLYPGALELCHGLAPYYEMAIVTNGFSVTQHGRFDRSPIREYIPHLFISEELGCQKPQKLFFDKVLEAMGVVERERVLVIGDSLNSDIQGGKNAGLDTCWYCPKGGESALPTYTVSSYEGIIQILTQNVR